MRCWHVGVTVTDVDICDLTFTKRFYVLMRPVTEIWPRPPRGRLLVSHVLWNHGACPPSHSSPTTPNPRLPPPPPALHHCEFPPYLCLCLMGSPCFGSIADVVQSHGGVFMDSSYPSSPVTGPLSRGQRRASEVSIASQVSGMADSYTASNIANSKCSQHQPASFSLFLALTQTLVVILLPPSFSPPYFSPYFLSFFPTLLLHLLSQTPPPPRYSDSTHTPRHSWSSLLGLIDVNSPLLFFLLLLLSPTRHLHL